jgi:hypothetical protein
MMARASPFVIPTVPSDHPHFEHEHMEQHKWCCLLLYGQHSRFEESITHKDATKRTSKKPTRARATQATSAMA